jgi:excisionase family DNA binding protein
MIDEDDDRLLTLSEVANHMNVTPNHVRSCLLIANGGSLPGVKVGRFWRVKKSDMIAYIEKRYLISNTRKPGE